MSTLKAYSSDRASSAVFKSTKLLASDQGSDVFCHQREGTDTPNVKQSKVNQPRLVLIAIAFVLLAGALPELKNSQKVQAASILKLDCTMTLNTEENTIKGYHSPLARQTCSWMTQ